MTALDLTRPVLGTMTFGDTVDARVGRTIWSTLPWPPGSPTSTPPTDTPVASRNGSWPRCCMAAATDVTLATKAGMPHPDSGDHSPLSPGGLRASLEGSLARLRTDHVELFYLHQPDRVDAAARHADHRGRTRRRGQGGRTGGVQLRRLADCRDQPHRRRGGRPAPGRSPSRSTTCWPAASRTSTPSSRP